MPGRPLLDNDKKDKVVSTYLSEEESKKLDDYIKDNYISSRAWFIRMLIFAKMENRLLELPRYMKYSKEDVEAISEMIERKDFITLLSFLQDEEKKRMLFQILQDKEKSDFLFSMIQDSKFLTGR